MTIEESIVEVDRLLHIGQVGHLHQGIAIIDPRPEVIVAAIILGLEASTAKTDWRSFSGGGGLGNGSGYGIGAGLGNGYGHGYGDNFLYCDGSGKGSGLGCGSGGQGDGRGDGRGGGDGSGVFKFIDWKR